MDHPRKNIKTKHDDRIILHFDLDCFYAQVYENKTPSLKSLPLGIRQKSLLATCNYPARRLGVKKLQSISSALAICPELVIVDGEDLTPFRDVSKRLYALLRSYSWNGRVERLGLDEVWMDVTDVIEYNLELLNRNDLEHSWFCMDREDPEKGFGFDARRVKGCVYGAYDEAEEGLLRTKLLIASHLAYYLRIKIEEEGYTTACGISTNKTLAKLVGNVNKPRNQTTLLSCGSDGEETVRRFMGGHQLRKVPGVGGKTAAILAEYFLSQSSHSQPNSTKKDQKSVTVADLLSLNPPLTPSTLSTLLSSGTSTTVTTSSARDILSLLNGHDPSPVKPARLLPTQISIEDTYHFNPLTSIEKIRSELAKITTSLLRRMKTDLLDDKTKWMARPKTLRLTTRPRVDPKEGHGYGYLRVSKSVPLPFYIFRIAGDDEEVIVVKQVAERLVTETLLPMFHQLHSQLISKDEKIKGKGYSIGLLNVCVTNMDAMDMSGSGDSRGGGRDIKDMFMRQREFTVYDHSGRQEPGDDDDDDDDRKDQKGHATTVTVRPGIEDNTPPDNDHLLVNEEGMDYDIRSLDHHHHHDTTQDRKDDDDDDDDGPHHRDPTEPITSRYEQDSMPPPTSTNDYFHIEDDDEVWDDNDDNDNNNDNDEEKHDNTWDNRQDEQQAREEVMDYNYNYSYTKHPSGSGSEDDGIRCPLCNHFIPLFALAAHERFHSIERDGD
ncbi:hypothetical protein B0T20DRAFT_441272 [Sordaria brevicollis]|uniref:UmuC domain-containing protein n=1 Tax=Sordaria brevicollis TaxID=83679 RepID=A0AAE0PCJ0_SORBR|nr:hypothetical protein B0T20DRAFT_441272 [Sordaria brevicollis]